MRRTHRAVKRLHGVLTRNAECTMQTAGRELRSNTRASSSPSPQIALMQTFSENLKTVEPLCWIAEPPAANLEDRLRGIGTPSERARVAARYRALHCAAPHPFGSNGFKIWTDVVPVRR